MGNVILRNTLSGPRWAGFPSAIRDVAWMLGLKLEMGVEKGFLRETARYTVEGEEAKVREFAQLLHESVEDYNK